MRAQALLHALAQSGAVNAAATQKLVPLHQAVQHGLRHRIVAAAPTAAAAALAAAILLEDAAGGYPGQQTAALLP